MTPEVNRKIQAALNARRELIRQLECISPNIAWLDPERVDPIVRDAIEAHADMSGRKIQARSEEVMRLVGIDPIHLKSYPHQLSGGMRQRAMIAMALLFTPDLIIMDEPTSALDVVAQRSLMRQVKDLQRRFGFAVIFVTHDMSLVSHFSDRLLVMYAGQVAEMSRTRELFDRPLHPYTRALLAAVPEPDIDRKLDLTALMEGRASDPCGRIAPFRPRGCHFLFRAPRPARTRCRPAILSPR